MAESVLMDDIYTWTSSSEKVLRFFLTCKQNQKIIFFPLNDGDQLLKPFSS